MPDRPTLHHQIRNEFTRTIAEYLRAHPEKLGDPQLNSDLDVMHTLMTRVLRHVDRYTVIVKDEGTAPEP